MTSVGFGFVEVIPAEQEGLNKEARDPGRGRDVDPIPFPGVLASLLNIRLPVRRRRLLIRHWL